MDRLHQQQESAEGQFALAGQKSLQHNGKSAELKGCNGRHERSEQNALRILTLPDERSVDQRIHQVAGVEPQVPDIAAERQEPAVREEECLNGKNRGHHEKGRMRAQQDGEDHPTPQVSARSCPRDGEIDHLRRKNKCPENAHQGDHSLVHLNLQLFGGITAHRSRSGPQCRSHRWREQCIRHVHDSVSFPI